MYFFFYEEEKQPVRGVEPSAAGGGISEVSEGQRSAGGEPASSGEGTAGHRNWRQYMKELGIQKAIDYLKGKGLPCEWPEKVVDLNDPATLKVTVTASSYKSRCPHYSGYWLCGGIGSVECTAAGELLPGIVWYEVCSKEYCKCPFYKTHIKEDNT